jgi:hypothetical protein
MLPSDQPFQFIPIRVELWANCMGEIWGAIGMSWGTTWELGEPHGNTLRSRGSKLPSWFKFSFSWKTIESVQWNQNTLVMQIWGNCVVCAKCSKCFIVGVPLGAILFRVLRSYFSFLFFSSHVSKYFINFFLFYKYMISLTLVLALILFFLM